MRNCSVDSKYLGQPWNSLKTWMNLWMDIVAPRFVERANKFCKISPYSPPNGRKYISFRTKWFIFIRRKKIHKNDVLTTYLFLSIFRLEFLRKTIWENFGEVGSFFVFIQLSRWITTQPAKQYDVCSVYSTTRLAQENDWLFPVNLWWNSIFQSPNQNEESFKFCWTKHIIRIQLSFWGW